MNRRSAWRAARASRRIARWCGWTPPPAGGAGGGGALVYKGSTPPMMEHTPRGSEHLAD
ncbi:hypothetical protein I5K72_29005 [Pseudomonas aeruginosa]|nr:hypothetical protein [Pseudomonas aeruginosa]